MPLPLPPPDPTSTPLFCCFQCQKKTDLSRDRCVCLAGWLAGWLAGRLAVYLAVVAYQSQIGSAALHHLHPHLQSTHSTQHPPICTCTGRRSTRRAGVGQSTHQALQVDTAAGVPQPVEHHQGRLRVRRPQRTRHPRADESAAAAQ
jgi:hypothetical protein